MSGKKGRQKYDGPLRQWINRSSPAAVCRARPVSSSRACTFISCAPEKSKRHCEEDGDEEMQMIAGEKKKTNKL